MVAELCEGIPLGSYIYYSSKLPCWLQTSTKVEFKVFKGISKVRLMLPLNFKGISKILKIKPLTFEENPLKIKGFSKDMQFATRKN